MADNTDLEDEMMEAVSQAFMKQKNHGVNRIRRDGDRIHLDGNFSLRGIAHHALKLAKEHQD